MLACKFRDVTIFVQCAARLWGFEDGRLIKDLTLADSRKPARCFLFTRWHSGVNGSELSKFLEYSDWGSHVDLIAEGNIILS